MQNALKHDYLYKVCLFLLSLVEGLTCFRRMVSLLVSYIVLYLLDLYRSSPTVDGLRHVAACKVNKVLTGLVERVYLKSYEVVGRVLKIRDKSLRLKSLSDDRKRLKPDEMAISQLK